jgi:hypothetical protein
MLYSSESSARIFSDARVGQVSQPVPDVPAVIALRSAIGLAVDTYGRDAGSVLVRAVVREELGDAAARRPTPDSSQDLPDGSRDAQVSFATG